MSAKKCFACRDGKIVCTLFGSEAIGDDCKTCEGTGWDTQWTDEICCPFCGHETSESYEMRSDEGEYTCDSCEKIFQYQRNHSVDYTTYKGPECIRDKTKHTWQPVNGYQDRMRENKTYVSCKECHKYSWEILNA